MRVLRIESWATLCELCEHHAVGEWIFRGVPDKSYRLIPAIGRPGARRSMSGVDLPFDAADATLMLQHFKRRARPLVPLSATADDLEWLALGRHHGLPTQFVDWTTSPFVAGFFACQAGGVVNSSNVMAAIYATQMPKVIDSAKEADVSKEPVAYFPPHVTPRIGAQQGLLTFHPDPSTAWEPEALIRYDIPSDIAFKIKVVLAKAGISEASVVPGLDGIAADLAWNYKLEFRRKVTLPSSSGRATDQGYAADGSRQIHIQMERLPHVSAGESEPPATGDEDK